MKICIITIYNSLNYGAYLQAYASYKYLTGLGHDVYMYEPEPSNFKYLYHALHLKDFKNLNFNYSLLRGYMKDWKQFKIAKNLKEEYDLVYIGSDELWNVDNYNFSHDDFYIGKKIQAKQIMTYAVSANTCSFENFSKIYGKGLNTLDSLDIIGVRDRHTASIVKQYGRDYQIVLDPTFLLSNYPDFKVEESEYILVYGYYFKNDEVEKILQFKNVTNKIMISVGFKHDWCDYNIPCSPLKFVSYIKNADFVITSTFHGTVFSIICNKQFYTFARENTKIHDILNKFDIEERNISDNNISNKIINYKDVNKIFSEEKKRSEYFIKNSIKKVGS